MEINFYRVFTRKLRHLDGNKGSLNEIKACLAWTGQWISTSEQNTFIFCEIIPLGDELGDLSVLGTAPGGWRVKQSITKHSTSVARCSVGWCDANTVTTANIQYS